MTAQLPIALSAGCVYDGLGAGKAQSLSRKGLVPPLAQDAQPDASVSDSQLLEMHLAGDQAAFPALVERYRKELFNFLARFVGDRALAEDVFQEAFLQVHLSAASFDTSRRLKPWLFTIAANKARDAMRSRSRRRAAPLDASVGGDEDSGSYADLMPADVPDPGENIQNFETRQAVQKIVAEMPENLRSVLLLSYFHDFPYKDISGILGVPLGTVKSRLHAAVGAFARKWKAHAVEMGYESEES